MPRLFISLQLDGDQIKQCGGTAICISSACSCRFCRRLAELYRLACIKDGLSGDESNPAIVMQHQGKRLRNQKDGDRVPEQHAVQHYSQRGSGPMPLWTSGAVTRTRTPYKYLSASFFLLALNQSIQPRLDPFPNTITYSLTLSLICSAPVPTYSVATATLVQASLQDAADPMFMHLWCEVSEQQQQQPQQRLLQ